MATIKELKAQAFSLREQAHAIDRRIEAIKEKRKETCPHEKTKIVEQEYMEEGRMRSPSRWQEEVCCKCKKVLRQGSYKQELVWSDVKEEGNG